MESLSLQPCGPAASFPPRGQRWPRAEALMECLWHPDLWDGPVMLRLGEGVQSSESLPGCSGLSRPGLDRRNVCLISVH